MAVPLVGDESRELVEPFIQNFPRRLFRDPRRERISERERALSRFGLTLARVRSRWALWALRSRIWGAAIISVVRRSTARRSMSEQRITETRRGEELGLPELAHDARADLASSVAEIEQLMAA